MSFRPIQSVINLAKRAFSALRSTPPERRASRFTQSAVSYEKDSDHLARDTGQNQFTPIKQRIGHRKARRLIQSASRRANR